MIKTINSTAFNGTTKIIGITDPHQETRKECALLTRALDAAKKNDNVLLLNGGDLFKGIYPRELEAQTYIDLKKKAPHLEIAIGLGNNDFGFDKNGLNFLEKVCTEFDKNGINVVCANVFDAETGKRPEWMKPYSIINRGGDRLFVTGFCLNAINNKGVKVRDSKDALKELKKDIDKEQPDGIIILNHDWASHSIELAEFAKSQNIKTDLILGGHEHYPKPKSFDNIFYPAAFGNSLYELDLDIKNGINKLNNIKAIENYNLPVDNLFNDKLVKCEEETSLTKPLVKSTLNLTKRYGEPCALGTFLADAMRERANTDGAFFSTGFVMAPLEYKKDKDITLYDFKKTIIADSEIKQVELNADELKDVFSHALKNWHNKSTGNGKFLQMSQNIEIIGQDSKDNNGYDVLQIILDDKPLLDKDGSALEPEKTYTFAIDSFIANGGQGFSTLQDAEKTDIDSNGKSAKINDILLDALIDAPNKYEKGSNYPKFKITDL